MIQLSTDRRLVEHSFDADGHIYHVPGKFVLSTSDVIELNGLSDVSMIPLDALKHAGNRGTALHLAVQAFETGSTPELAVQAYEREKNCRVFDEVMERLWFYRSWRSGKQIKLAAEMEVPRVYEHEGTGYYIGATLDMPAWIDGELTILDLKTCFKQYGEKAKQDRLKWRLQLQSYKEALMADGRFWMKTKPCEIKRAVLHLHPECGKTGTKGTQTGFEFHPFDEFDDDDPFGWDASLRVAMLKIKNGYKLARRNVERDLKSSLRASLEIEEQPIF